MCLTPLAQRVVMVGIEKGNDSDPFSCLEMDEIEKPGSLRCKSNWVLNITESSNRHPRMRVIKGEAELAFVNEYIPKADYEKYNLRRICGEHNLTNRGSMYSNDWTIDRDCDAFLIRTWVHRESNFIGYAFFWKGVWAFFEICPVEYKKDAATSTCWFRCRVNGMLVPAEVALCRDEFLTDLQSAITASSGGPSSNYSHRSATIEFITKVTKGVRDI